MFKILYPRRIPEHRNPALVAATLCLCAVWLVALQRSGAFIGTQAFLIGLVVAATPVAVYLPLALLVDRYEKEPRWMLAATFLWGATIAVFLAALINPLVVGDSASGTVINAPSVRGAQVEELVKGAALFLLFFWQRDEFDNTVDGIVYATMIGLGFAMTENVHWYAKAWAEGGSSRLIDLLMARGVLSPFSHPLFTMMTGIGLGLAREQRSRWIKAIAPLLGLTVAMLLHMEWNAFIVAGLFDRVYYLGLMVPTFAFMLFVVTREQARERILICGYLRRYADSGVLGEADLETLCRFGGRMRALRAAIRDDGVKGMRRTARFQQATAELAFHNWRIERGISNGAVRDAEREREYLRIIAETRPLRPAAETRKQVSPG